MPDTSREQWIAILEAASSSSPDQMNEQWEWLMDQLALPLEYFPSVLEALRQGRWRNATNPKAYLKSVATREAKKLGIVEKPPQEVLPSPRKRIDGSLVSQEDILEDLAYATAGREPFKGADGVWRHHDNGWDPLDRPEWQHEFDSPWDYLLSKLPDDLKVENQPSPDTEAAYDHINALTDDFHLHIRTPVVPNWKAWGERAGFDEWDQLVLECRVSRKSREKALAEQPDEVSRKALQAAWKKFDRRGMERLRNALKINSNKSVPDDALSDTR